MIRVFSCISIKERGQNVALILSVVGKIYAGVLVDSACKVPEGVIGDEQEGSRAGRGV